MTKHTFMEYICALLLVACSVLLVVAIVQAAPVATAGDDSVVVTLTDEPCALPAVANLKLRATWTEKGVTHEGCFAVSQGLAMFYFADRTVVAIPVQAFTRVTGV